MGCGFCGKDVPDGTGNSSHYLCLAEYERRKSLRLCTVCGEEPLMYGYVVGKNCFDGSNPPYAGYENCFTG